MGRGTELQVDFNCDFELIGIVTSVKEYKLAWCLNQHLRLNLAKTKDLVINFIAEPTIIVSNFSFSTTHVTFKLLKNRSIESHSDAFLLPELKNMDYFLMIKNESDTFDLDIYLKNLTKVSVINFFKRIDLTSIENKENLIF